MLFVKKLPKMVISNRRKIISKLSLTGTIRALLLVFALLLVVTAGQLWSRPAKSWPQLRSMPIDLAGTGKSNDQQDKRQEQQEADYEVVIVAIDNEALQHGMKSKQDDHQVHLHRNHDNHKHIESNHRYYKHLGDNRRGVSSKDRHKHRHYKHHLQDSNNNYPTNTNNDKYKQWIEEKAFSLEQDNGKLLTNIKLRNPPKTTTTNRTDIIRLRRELALQATILSRLQILESYDAMLNEFAFRQATMSGGYLGTPSMNDSSSQLTKSSRSLRNEGLGHKAQIISNERDSERQSSSQLPNGIDAEPDINDDYDDNRPDAVDDREQLCLLKLPFQLNDEMKERLSERESLTKIEQKSRLTSDSPTNPFHAKDPANYCCHCLSSIETAKNKVYGRKKVESNIPTPGSHIPPYVENLYKRIASRASSRSEAVLLMPYKSLAMRSFRQPEPEMVAFKRRTNTNESSYNISSIGTNFYIANGKPKAKTSNEEENLPTDIFNRNNIKLVGMNHDDGECINDGLSSISGGKSQVQIVQAEQHQNQAQNPSNEEYVVETSNLVVELSLLEPADSKRGHQLNIAEKANEAGSRSEPSGMQTEPGKKVILEERPREKRKAKQMKKISNRRSIPKEVCNLNERLLPIEERSKICYWFPISDKMASRLNGTSNSSGIAERLVEAELHLYKLKPLLKHNIRLQQAENDADRGPAAQDDLYHLKTNLLEVSLFQVLPSGKGEQRRDGGVSSWPLRLLDIRRIDLHSSGWEAFYVKRAVEDWIRDSSLNLGLVIKTTSMFDEPIRIGLIRFADMYDSVAIVGGESAEDERHQQYSEPVSGGKRKTSAIALNPSRADIDKQPTLMVYTSSTSISS